MGTGSVQKNTISRQTIGNWLIMAGIFVITTLEWHFFDWYQTFTRFGTLITFFCLAGAFFCYQNVKDALKDKLFWLMAVTDIIALVNLFILGSNKGCLLIIVDFMLILYLSDKIDFTRRQTFVFLAYTAFFFFYWTIDVKGYFKGYNTNYGGLILITGFAALMIIMQVFNGELVEKYYALTAEFGKAEGRRGFIKRFFYYPVVYLFFIALAFNIISWYRSRTALMGLLALLAIIIIPRKVVMNKYVYNMICVAATVGSVAFSGIYILLGQIGDGGMQLFYKDIISGRNRIWNELWRAFLEKPLTGIGSSYVMKLDFMEGMLEAHSAMMDILVIHGVIVFIPVCGLLLYRLIKLRNVFEKSTLGKTVFAAVICILITGFFENYYIVQPFSLILLTILCIKPERISDI